MEKLNKDMTLKNIVTANPASYKILEKYKLDYCCGGNKTLKNACDEKSLDMEKIILEINDLEKDEAIVDVNNLTLSELVDHIESTHHVFMKKEIPDILALLEKAVNRHNTEDLKNLNEIFKTLVEDITAHLEKEEQILFPAVRELEEFGEIKSIACFDKSTNPLASIANPINQMEMEHEAVGNLLKKINQIIDKEDFKQCMTLELLYTKLKGLEEDLHRHIHKENYVLFPKAIEKEGCPNCSCK
ncbi:MAG: Iron-sulfur cluster repair protein YtfE [Candidatus Anoxychlamydiales bacterium]|nr:Iron-sulfur cluster repair protein YtfE [Candidatus Anoxychlamydiales bacterium]